MKIGFFSNQLDNRGTGDALYKYAHYNETILGNKSVIFTNFGASGEDPDAFRRFVERFEVFNVGKIPRNYLDALYHIKSGYNEGFDPHIPYLVHSVFDNDPHGTVYATVSPWMGTRFGLEYVPHIVELAESNDNLRKVMEIPEDAVVFGRHGGTDTFDIPFVKDVISLYVQKHRNVYFLFLNTDRFVDHERVIHMPASVDPIYKRLFINTCDAMIHARSRGETFGLSVGEFAIAGKPVITYSESHEKAHLQELGNFALTYSGPTALESRFNTVMKGPMVSWGYGQYTPENVMKKFDEVFLSCVK